MFQKLRGVFFGWWIVAASFVIYVIVGGTAVYGFTAFFNPISSEMGWSKAETSFAFSLRSVEGGVVQPLLGFFVDRIGPRKCIFAGLVIMAGALFLISRISTLATFYTGFFLLALGNTMATGIPEYSAVANWFRKRRSLAMGLLTAGFGVSGIMTPILTGMIHSFGWRETLIILAPIVLVIGLPLSFLIRHRPEPYGLRPDGEKIAGDMPATPAHKAVPIKESSEAGLTIKECMATRTFWLMMLFTFCTSFASSSMQVHEMPHLISLGISDNIAALTMTGITVGSLVGRLGFSWLGDKYSKKNLLIIAAAMQAVGVLIFSRITSAWMIIPFLVFYAPGFGAPIPLLPAIQADFFGTKAFASVRGLMALGYTIPGILGPFFAGWLFDVQGHYTTAWLIYAGFTALAVPVMMMATLTRGKSFA